MPTKVTRYRITVSNTVGSPLVFRSTSVKRVDKLCINFLKLGYVVEVKKLGHGMTLPVKFTMLFEYDISFIERL